MKAKDIYVTRFQNLSEEDSFRSMDYERIEKPEGFSPGKLRTMLMGVDQSRSGADGCKDVNVVSDHESAAMAFEFQRRGPGATAAAPFSKAAPSKWDDAHKWIASPTSNRPKGRKASRHLSAKPAAEVPDEPHTKQMDVNHPVADSPVSVHSGMTPSLTARSVSMRDMGTEMTPIASQEPSRTATPVRATTPTRSPSSSPPRPLPSLGSNQGLSEEELHMRTRREIMALGTQLGKANIAAWAASKESGSTSLKSVAAERDAIETRATAWEEAEKAKYLARFKQEEMKIQAWENHQKAKTEAEMRKVEVEVERMRGRAHEKLMKKLAAARYSAEEKRAAAEARRNRQAATTEQQAEYIRRTGRVPCLFRCCCF